ncbi:putative CRISPR-associated helicase Cas3' [Mycobacterium canetti]|nr:putative CRISPR-associated helicase Cas3' [Mycobacterium canetti]
MGLLWAKSDTTDGDGTKHRPHLLLGHMIDTAQVAGILWDEHLADSVKRLVRSIAGGSDNNARQLVTFLAGVHDLGKASPAFQIKSADLARRLQQVTGVDLCPSTAVAKAWHHTLAGGAAIKQLLDRTPWQPHVDWLSAVVGGHHGTYPEKSQYRVKYDASRVHGEGRWEQWRHDALEWLLRELRIIPASGTLNDLPDWLSVPPVGTQVILAGLVIQSDWIASDGRVMPGLWDLEEVSARIAHTRASEAVDVLRFSPGWRLRPLDNLFEARFPFSPCPVQVSTEAAVAAMRAPGLVIVEAPMGEGKTEAAMVAAELLGRRFGAHGVFVGLPTQATTDAMFTRVKNWLEMVQPGAALGLSHGKSVVNAEYAGLQRWRAAEVGVDCGCDVHSPSEWFSGRKRLLLSPHVVGTIDNILLAGAQIRHVALHHLAFAQKVVVLDEVHAADIYMSQFLERALAWLGASQVPVVLLSATLPASMRHSLVRAYTGQAVDVGNAYPQITTATGTTCTTYTPPAGTTKTIHLEVLDEAGLGGQDTTSADNSVASLLRERLGDGGCVLAIRNTVTRAQKLYLALKAAFPADRVVLLHSRFTAGDRATHTAELLRLLGDTKKGAQRPRPPHHRLIVVATQVAEQSLDIDADLLLTDLCPIDLLLQRAGRLHRHIANDPLRPARLDKPTVFVTRMRAIAVAATDPHLGFPPPDAGFVYPPALLARTAQILYRTTCLTVPGDVPGVIAEVYEHDQHRCDNPAWEAALTRWDSDRSWTDGKLEIQASNAALEPPDKLTNVHGLNRYVQDDERLMVRAGEIPLEVCLLQQDSAGLLHGLGSDITFQPDGTVVGSIEDADVGARVIASTVRISNKMLIAALSANPPLPRWVDHPWLRNTGVLVLDATATATVSTDRGNRRVTYSHELGLSWNT